MNKSNLVPYVDVIRSIETASMAELKAIARVENAILKRPVQEAPTTAPKVFDARKARRESARASAEQASATSKAISSPLQGLEKALERNTAAMTATVADKPNKTVTNSQKSDAVTQSAVSVSAAVRFSAPYPIAGIHLNGEPSVYRLKKNESRRNYRIEMEVTAGNDLFHITMVISDNGHCTTTISGAKMDSVRYSGNLKPIESGEKKKIREPDAIRI